MIQRSCHVFFLFRPFPFEGRIIYTNERENLAMGLYIYICIHCADLQSGPWEEVAIPSISFQKEENLACACRTGAKEGVWENGRRLLGGNLVACFLLFKFEERIAP